MFHNYLDSLNALHISCSVQLVVEHTECSSLHEWSRKREQLLYDHRYKYSKFGS